MKRSLRLRTLPCLVLVATATLCITSPTLGKGLEGDLAVPPEDERRCLEVTSDGLYVEECLQWSVLPSPQAEVGTSMPDAMRSILAAELQWREEFLRQTLSSVETTGVYSRWARWQGQERQRLGLHPFASRRSWSERSVFDLEVSYHGIESVHAEFDPAGNGSLEISFAHGAGLREVIFEEGRVTSDRDSSRQRADDFYMGCYIDTPAFDVFRPDFCAHLGYQASTAVFKVFLPYTPSAVVWVTPNASCSGLWCTAPISPGQTVNGYAYWVINGIPTGPLSATARYFFEPLGGF